MSAYSMFRRKGKINKKISDHLSIKLVINMPVISSKGNNKKKPIINMNNKEGWIRYPEVSDRYVNLIKNAIENIKDVDMLESRLLSINQAIKVEAFGIIWVRQGDSSKKQKRENLKR